MSLDVRFYYDVEPNPETPIQIWDDKNRWRKLTRAEWVAAFPNFSIDEDYATTRTVFNTNITHNLGEMASAVCLYDYLWCPNENDITSPAQIIEPLRAGIAMLKADPAHYEQYSSPNGWGTYKDFIPWLEAFLAACEQYPDAKIGVSR